ncbi:FAD binding domain-containing protein [Halomonas sp. BM-2019]|uniref:FAD binding domain-containing protein n=1 Tax=Halomonas sp. BM-2019 TaxID=2811227 RepID=UPI001B3C1FE5|nr:MAG: FAD binding domain-containing protein [Halomonas sp. BM-2019]
MKPAAFDYLRPASRREACELLHEHGDEARLIAGGQSLMAVLNMRLAQPKQLIDIAGIEDLHYIERRDDHLAVGAGVTQAELLEYPGLAEAVPLLALAMPWIGHWQTRNRGTVCGSIAHADPSAELPLCLTILGGEVVLENHRGKARRVAARDFFQGVLTTDRRPSELITEVRFPLARPGVGYRFLEVAMRHGDFAIVALAAVIEGQRITFGVGGVADRPVSMILPSNLPLEDALNAFAWSLETEDDHHASAAYRRQMIRELGGQVIAGAPTDEEPAHARQS